MIGRTVSHYRILEKLGEGGMGVVYRAEDRKLERTVALKFLLPRAISQDDGNERIRREARALAALDHPNLVTVFEIDEADGLPFLAMAFIDGVSLRRRIANGPLRFDEAIDIACQTATGLAAAHEKSIVHGDIKPANILLSGRGQVKITDFGLARLPGVVRAAKAGIGAGTPAYMSPEQGRGEHGDSRSDIWSLGVVLYEMLAGHTPFSGDTEAAVVYAVGNNDPQPLTEIRRDLPSGLDSIVSRALARDRNLRYQDIAEMRRDLQALRAGRFSTGRAGGLLPSTRSAWIRMSIMALLAAVLLWQPWRHGTPVESGSMGRPAQVTTDDAREIAPCLSADGSRIVYASDISGNFEIYSVAADGGRPQRLTTDPARDESPAWFPDGRSLAFVSDRTGSRGIWRIDASGGTPELLVPRAETPAISPDGKSIACARQDSLGTFRIGVVPLDSLESATLLTCGIEPAWNHLQPAWSPDGRRLCFAVHQHGLWLLSRDGRWSRRLTPDGEIDFDPVWSADGTRIYFTSYRENTTAIWYIAADGGRPQRLTMGTGPESHPSVSRDGARLAYSTRNEHYQLVLRDLAGTWMHILPGAHNDVLPSLAPDGSSVVFVSNRWGGAYELWRQDLVTGRPVGQPLRLTEQDGHASHPTISPDGRRVVYYRNIANTRDLWLLDFDGGQPVQLTDDPVADDVHPAWSPDGSRLVFASERDGEYALWVAAIDDEGLGPAWRLTSAELSAYAPVWSPDGRRIAFAGRQREEGEAWVTEVAEGASPQQLTFGGEVLRLRWDAVTDRLLVCGRWGEERYSLRSISPDGGVVQHLSPPIEFESSVRAPHFDISSDGRFLVFTRVDARGDIWVLNAGTGSF